MNILLYSGKYEGYQMLRRLIDLKKSPAYLFILKGSSPWEEEWSHKIAGLARENGIDFSLGVSMNSEKVRKIIRSHKPCVFFFSNCRQLLDRNTIELIDFPVNFHNSLLPAYRGFAPNTWPIINGETYTGTTMLRIVPGTVDSGPILAQKRIAIREGDTGWSLEKCLAELNVRLMEEHLPALLSGRIRTRKQDEKKATYACKRIPDDGLIDWAWPVERIFNLVRALTRPYPGAFTFLCGRRLFIWEAKIDKKAPVYVGRIPGAVTGIGQSRVAVLTGDGVCRIGLVQLEGEEARPAAEVLDSLNIRLGEKNAG